MRMSQEIKTKWVEALRSGDYMQGVGRLKDDKGAYCCLGVLQMCVLGEVDRDIAGIPELMPSPDFWKKMDPEWTDNYPPRLTLDLAEMNDGEWDNHKTFEELAAIIEEEVETIP